MNRYIATIQQTYRHKSGKTKTRRVVRAYPAESMVIATLAASSDLRDGEKLVGTMRKEGETFTTDVLAVPDRAEAFSQRVRSLGGYAHRLHR